MKRFKKVLSLALVLCMTATMAVGCGSKDEKPQGSSTVQSSESKAESSVDNSGNQVEEVAEVFWKTLDPNTEGDISIMCWSGDSVYYENIGSMDWAPEDITSQNVAAIYAMAKEFNKVYPNISINLWAKADDPDGNDTPWLQELENFKAEHGKYPDVYASTDLAGDLSRGMVADLSVYSEEPLYQSFNESLMNMMAFYGFQAGLPQFTQPWGVYVNKALAEANNIEVPDADWDIDEYTEFVSSADGSDGFWGALNAPISFVSSGSTTVLYQMANYSGSGDRVDIDTDEVRDLLSYIPTWSQTAIFPQNTLGNVPGEIMDDGWWWGYRFFCRNYALTYDGDPWMLGAAAVGQAEDGTWPVNSVESNDWDIYPRPSTDSQPNTIGICVDPMAIHNYAMDDGDPAWSDAEKAQLDLAYAFGSFWCGSSEAMQARADQMYSDNGTLRTSLNDSFPLVTGDAFDEQMDIWYSTSTHTRYADADLMPGFHYVVELWENAQFWDVSDKCYPYWVYIDGTETACLNEWLNITGAGIAGVESTEAGWLDNVKARLSDWNADINERFVEAEAAIKDGLKSYYGFSDADF